MRHSDALVRCTMMIHQAGQARVGCHRKVYSPPNTQAARSRCWSASPQRSRRSHLRTRASADGDQPDEQSTPEGKGPEEKETNGLAQLAADALASPLLYITVGAAVAVKVVSSSEQARRYCGSLGSRSAAAAGLQRVSH